MIAAVIDAYPRERHAREWHPRNASDSLVNLIQMQ